jgi:hypothetical protein
MNRLPDGRARESAAVVVYYLSSLPTVFDNDPNDYEQIYSKSRMTTMIQDMYLPGERDVIHVNNCENGDSDEPTR